MAYEKLKAWAALILGIYLVVQCVAMVVGGSVFAAVGSPAVGVPVILLGLAVVYASYRLASWGWKHI